MLREEKKFFKSLDFRSLSRHIGTKWKKIDEIQKNEYKAMAEKDKKRYALEILAWQNELEEFVKNLDESEENQQPEVNSGPVPVHNCSSSTQKSHVSFKSAWSRAPEGQPGCLVPSLAMQGRPPNSGAESSCSHLMLPQYSAFSQGTLQNDYDVWWQAPTNAKDEDPIDFRLETSGSFGEAGSLANLVKEIGNDGIDYLRAVLL